MCERGHGFVQRKQPWEMGTKWWYLQESGIGSHGEPLHFADVLMELGLSACLTVEALSVHCFSQCTIKPLHK